MKSAVLSKILRCKKNGKKLFAVLIDPEKRHIGSLPKFIDQINRAKVDFIFVGGSQLKEPIDQYVLKIKELTKIPVVLFPGNAFQFSPHADAILFISLISGRNPELLIGEHVKSARMVAESGVECISTGYILVDGGKTSSVERVSKTKGLSSVDEIVDTAIAGYLLAKKMIYLEAGSGADRPVPKEIVKAVRANITTPIIVGGGVCSTQMINSILEAGADIVVVGNYFEKNSDKIAVFSNFIKKFSRNNGKSPSTLQ